MTDESKAVEAGRDALANLDRRMVTLRDLRREADEASAVVRSTVFMDTGLEHFKELCRSLNSAKSHKDETEECDGN